MALVAEVLFVASLLLHELGHAVVARREGMTIDGITLWLFGGVARFRGMFPSAGAEFRIAIAGPVVTAVLAVLFVAVARLTHLGPAVDGAAAWLGYINLLLLGFNLLPALPLDGGRVLRAALWRAKRDYAWATRMAATIGRGFGLVMIGGGAVLFFLHGSFSDLWLAVIGWFLLGAAKAEGRIAAAGDALDGLSVGDVMTRQPVTAPADETLRDFMDQVAWSHERAAYPVLDGEQPVGLLLLRQVAKTPPHEWASVRVRDAMLPLAAVTVVSEAEPAVEAIRALVVAGADLALVVDDSRLAGVLSAGEVERGMRPGRRRRTSGSVRPVPGVARQRPRFRDAA